MTAESAPRLIEPTPSEQSQSGVPQAAAGPMRLGRYELLGEIASGGMATVFLGRSLGAGGFQRLVAIKRMHPHLERDEEFVASFLEEARLAARIRHPNVVATLDVEDGEAPFLVMEYVEGDRLSGLIKEHVLRARAGLPLPIAMRIAIDSLEGLHAAHELVDDDGQALDLIHRDISPQNILIGVDGVSRVTDFGIAKAIGRASHTREGELKGKIAYMSPEQLTNPTGIDRRVDVFALGILTWEMLTGRRLFRAATDMETIGVVLHAEIPEIRPLAPQIPEEVEAVVMRALSRDPNERWATAQEFARALEAMNLAAPQRIVADFVKATVGEKLERERARLRSGWVVNTPISASGSGTSRSRELPVSEVRRTGSVQVQQLQSSSKTWVIAVLSTIGLLLSGTVLALVYQLTRTPSLDSMVVRHYETRGPNVLVPPTVNNGATVESDAAVTAQTGSTFVFNGTEVLGAADAGALVENTPRVRVNTRVNNRTNRTGTHTRTGEEPDNGCNPYVQRCPNQ